VVLGGSRLGLSTESGIRLLAGLDEVYREIGADALFRDVPSALPYCLANARPAKGHYFAYYPPKLADDTRTIVFLHGYGGNFLFYTYLLKEAFPDAVILLPSWSGSWYDGTFEYLEDMLQDVKQRRSFSVRKPCLVAISGGGPAGFRFYNQHPDRFSCLVSIASAPSGILAPKLDNELKILMINGKKDTGFRIAPVKRIAEQLADRMPGFRFHVIDGDHFFLLSHRTETFRTIKEFFEKNLRPEKVKN
jgi:pimeloyl-ACP methyl ester carboxylesterase